MMTGSDIFNVFLLMAFFLAGLSFVLTTLSAIEAFLVTKGRFNRYLSCQDIFGALKYSFAVPLSLVFFRPAVKTKLRAHTPLAYSYIGLFLSFTTSVLGGIIWVVFFRDMTDSGIAPLIFFFWYISLILKNIGINAFHLRLIAAHMNEEYL